MRQLLKWQLPSPLLLQPLLLPLLLILGFLPWPCRNITAVAAGVATNLTIGQGFLNGGIFMLVI